MQVSTLHERWRNFRLPSSQLWAYVSKQWGSVWTNCAAWVGLVYTPERYDVISRAGADLLGGSVGLAPAEKNQHASSIVLIVAS
jgi:hypothetical protein